MPMADGTAMPDKLSVNGYSDNDSHYRYKTCNKVVP